MRELRCLDEMNLDEFRQKVLIPILRDKTASRIVTYGNLKYITDEELSDLRNIVIHQGFDSELVASDQDLLVFILACATKACEHSRHK